jgi:hypothetical protein
VKVLVRELLFEIVMMEAKIPVEECWDVDTTCRCWRCVIDGGDDDGGGRLRKFTISPPTRQTGRLGTMFFDTCNSREWQVSSIARPLSRFDADRMRNDEDGGVGRSRRRARGGKEDRHPS